METLSKKIVKNSLVKVFRDCILLLVLFITSAKNSFAQSNEPSLGNLKKTGAAAAEELERIEHEEFMSYVYMVVGFSIVIAIAWISTVNARKRSKAETEAKMKFIQQNLANKKHAHGNGHGHTLHKARR
jgi:heme/copper-type cytochrome/quinol oxidase subunit 2